MALRIIDFVEVTSPGRKVVMSQETTRLAKAFHNKPAGDTQDRPAKHHHVVTDPGPREDLGLRPIDTACMKKAMTTDDEDAVTCLVKVEPRHKGPRVLFDWIKHAGVKRKADRFEAALPDHLDRAVQ